MYTVHMYPCGAVHLHFLLYLFALEAVCEVHNSTAYFNNVTIIDNA